MVARIWLIIIKAHHTNKQFISKWSISANSVLRSSVANGGPCTGCNGFSYYMYTYSFSSGRFLNLNILLVIHPIPFKFSGSIHKVSMAQKSTTALRLSVKSDLSHKSLLQTPWTLSSQFSFFDFLKFYHLKTKSKLPY